MVIVELSLLLLLQLVLPSLSTTFVELSYMRLYSSVAISLETAPNILTEYAQKGKDQHTNIGMGLAANGPKPIQHLVVFSIVPLAIELTSGMVCVSGFIVPFPSLLVVMHIRVPQAPAFGYIWYI